MKSCRKSGKSFISLRMSFTKPLYGAFLLFVTLVSVVTAANAKSFPQGYGVASAHPLATETGMHVLQSGGNAFDAAVAISAVLGVVEPYSSGMGGGGFWLLYDAEKQKSIFIDGRETAPSSANKDFYQDREGEVIKGLSVDGPMAAGIPGQVAALELIAEKYGSQSFSSLLQPAIQYAEQGFIIDERYREMVAFRLQVLQKYKNSRFIFLKKDALPAVGDRIRQEALARTLTKIASEGADVFYKGELAGLLVKGVNQEGGKWDLKDLASYKAIERLPVVFDYQGAKITTAPPPSSGGLALATILNVLDVTGYQQRDFPDKRHLTIEAMRRAYADRASFLGDPEFVQVPVKQLMHPMYARGLAAGIRMDRATPSSALPGPREREESYHTTHFSVVDAQGNRVSATLTINYPFGSGFVVPGTGILLNDEMDDFSSKPGVPNVYGLVGAQANAIASGKRPLSSMSPTFVETDEKVTILGTPGGSRIISMVLLGILDAVEGLNADAIVSHSRFHHQYLPDEVFYEAGAFREKSFKQLQARGHRLKRAEKGYGNMQVVQWNKKTGQVDAASDPRGVGAALTSDKLGNKK